MVVMVLVYNVCWGSPHMVLSTPHESFISSLGSTSPLSFGRLASVRYSSVRLSSVPVLYNFILVYFNDHRRHLHSHRNHRRMLRYRGLSMCRETKIGRKKERKQDKRDERTYQVSWCLAPILSISFANIGSRNLSLNKGDLRRVRYARDVGYLISAHSSSRSYVLHLPLPIHFVYVFLNFHPLPSSHRY